MFEETVKELQEKIRALESGKLNLEESLQCFEEGVKLTRKCQDYLKKAEQRIEILTKDPQPEASPGEGFKDG